MNERVFQVETEQQREHLSRFVLRQPFPFQAQLGPLREKRSPAQNARLWALHTLAAAVTGYSAEEMHEHALCRHFGYAERDVIDPLTGEFVKKRITNKRSSMREKGEFSKFMEETESWYGVEFGVWLPVGKPA